MHAHNDNQRPASFDAMLVSYRPGLARLAQRLGYFGEQREDLVTDTIIHCLKHWEKYRAEDSEWNYLYWTMRTVAGNYADRSSSKMQFVSVPIDWFEQIPMQASQDDYVELSQVLAKLTGGGGDIVLRRAMTGDTYRAMAAELGVTHQRVQQIESKARRKLAVACGRVAA